MEETPILYALRQEVLHLGDASLEVAVLNNRARVIIYADAMLSLGRSPRASGGIGLSAEMPAILRAKNLKPFIPNSLHQAPIFYRFRPKNRRVRGGVAVGISAEAYADVCQTYRSALDAGALYKSQEVTGQYARVRHNAFAKLGIVKAVDLAVGYSEGAEADQALLRRFVMEQPRPWERRFHSAFYEALFTLLGWHFDANNNRRPPFVGRFTADYVYACFPKGTLSEIRARKGRAGKKGTAHHQWLTTDRGLAFLNQHLHDLELLMRISPSFAVFRDHFERAFGEQCELAIDYRARPRAA